MRRTARRDDMTHRPLYDPKHGIVSQYDAACMRWTARIVRILRFALALVVSAGSLAGCQPQDLPQPDQSATVDTAAIRSSLDSLAAAVMRADNTGDAELYASTWADDGIMSVSGSPPVLGRDSIISAFKRRPPLPPGSTLQINPIEIRVLSAEWAYAFGVDTLSYTPKGEQEPIKETSTFLVLIRKTPEGWKTYREVLSSDQPPSSPR